MTSTMPQPTKLTLTRVDSFSTDDLHKSFSNADLHNAFKASAAKPRNHLSLKIVLQATETSPPPPPSPLRESRPSSPWDQSSDDGLEY